MRARESILAYLACQTFTPGQHSCPKITQDGKDGDEVYGHMENTVNGRSIGYKYFDFKGLSKVTIRTRAYFHGKFQIMTSWDGELLSRKSTVKTQTSGGIIRQM